MVERFDFSATSADYRERLGQACHYLADGQTCSYIITAAAEVALREERGMLDSESALRVIDELYVNIRTNCIGKVILQGSDTVPACMARPRARSNVSQSEGTTT
jgi:hypothetical protein